MQSFPQLIKDSVKQTLQVQAEEFEDKYIGLPTPMGHMQKGRYQNLQGKLLKRMMLRGDGLPSQGGKDILIKAVAQAIPTYTMGVFKLPMSVCDDLTRMVRNYWWGSSNGHRKTHWKAWDQVTRPK